MQKSLYSNSVHLIARAVIIADDRVLLAKCKGASNTFLPGGHIEYKESAISSLQRELLEELHLELNIFKYLGLVEHTYLEKDFLEHEINLCFLGCLPSPEHAVPVDSKEKHLDFLWCPVSKLSVYNLQPYPLQSLIPILLNNDDLEIWFESTIQDIERTG